MRERRHRVSGRVSVQATAVDFRTTVEREKQKVDSAADGGSEYRRGGDTHRQITLCDKDISWTNDSMADRSQHGIPWDVGCRRQPGIMQAANIAYGRIVGNGDNASTATRGVYCSG